MSGVLGHECSVILNSKLMHTILETTIMEYDLDLDNAGDIA